MTLDDMKDYVRGKDIILVGNSLDALEYAYGDYIDGFDITVRFGKGLPEPVIFDRIGTNTHIWVTGQLRMKTFKEVLKVTKILFNESLYNPEFGRPPVDHCSMYSEETITEIANQYNIDEGKRLSAGAITAHWFANVCDTWNSMTFINFDAFTTVTNFHASISDSEQFTGSWHLPMLRPEIIPEDYSIQQGSLAHDSRAEIAIYRDILKKQGTYWRGAALNPNPEYTLREKALVKWSPGRGRPPSRE
jgi:hypothetical protein